MPIKEQMFDLLGVLATASITSIGFAIGGTIGASVMAGIGINLSSSIIGSGSTKLKELWLSSNNGILNHDLQLAVVRGFIKALTHLETKYFELSEAGSLPKGERDAIKFLFKELRDQTQVSFYNSLGRAVKELEVKDYLYGSQEDVTDKLWERLNGTHFLDTYDQHFGDFFRHNLLSEVLFWFGEELKTDNRENNKAWRAFQRMLLEGIQADVKAVRASQDMIQQDLQTLDVIREQLDQLKESVDHRLPEEPFQKEVATGLTEIQSVLHDVAQTTKRTEIKVDTIAADIKTLLGGKGGAETPKIPGDVKALFEQGLSLRNSGKYKESGKTFREALDLATGYDHRLAIAAAKRYLAIILKEGEETAGEARRLLEECLREFRELSDEKHLAMALYDLGVIEIENGTLDQAEAYLFQSLELDKKNNQKIGIASTLQQLGRVKSERGRTREAIDLEDEALKYFLSAYHDGEAEKDNDLLLWIAGSYQNKGLAYETLGKVEEVEACYVHSLEWHRKSGYKPDMGKLLYLLARLKYREGQYEEGTKFLDETIEIYSELSDFSFLARCLDLRGRLHYTQGQIDKAITVFESALAAAEKTKNYDDQVIYLDKLGQVYLKDKKQPERAIEYFEKARDLSLRVGLLKGYAEALQNLAQVAHIEHQIKERDRLLSEGVQTLEKLLLIIQAEPKKAFITGEIGLCYERMKNFPQALAYYQRAKKMYEAISDVGGIANCLGSIARIKGFLGKRNEEFDAYRELKQLVDGTPYYDMIAGAAINLGEINMQIGNLDEAKMLFQEADFLCKKYNIHFAEHLRRAVRRLNDLISIRKPPKLSFEELVRELFALVDWFPEAKDSLLRLWLWGRVETLMGNFRSAVGIKLMICQDDLETFRQVAEILRPYSDLCLQVVSTEFPGTGMDIVPFPEDKEIFFECAMPYRRKEDGAIVLVSIKDGGLESRYHFTSDKATSKITGNEGSVVMGWALGLPDQAHQLILSSPADELISRKVFFLPYERHIIKDKLLNDLSFFGKGMGLIPVYFKSLPNSENAAVLHSAELNLPVLSAVDIESQRRSIRKVRHAFQNLLSVTKASALSALNDFTFEVDELADVCERSQSLKTQIHIFEFPGALDKELHIAIVVNER